MKQNEMHSTTVDTASDAANAADVRAVNDLYYPP